MRTKRPYLIAPGCDLWVEYVDWLRHRLTCVGFKPVEVCNNDYHHATEIMELLAADKGIVIDIDGSLAIVRRHGGTCDCRIIDITASAAS